MFKNKSFYEKKKKGKQVGNLGNGVGLGTGFNIKTNNRLLSVFMDKWVNNINCPFLFENCCVVMTVKKSHHLYSSSASDPFKTHLLPLEKANIYTLN